MDYDGRVVFKIDGDDSGLKKAINGAQSSLGGLKSALVKLGLGALFTKGFSDAVKSTNQFESSLAKASTLFGSVAVDTENLSKKILDLSTATGQSADSIGNSLYNALSAGIPVTEDMGDAMEFLTSATRLSVAGFTDVDTAVTATAKVMNAYGMSMSEAGRVGEILMETQNLGITTVNELGGALATVTPIASSFGVAFEQVGASLAVMTKQGTDTATATTQLRGLISELGQDGTQASKNLQKAFARAGLEYRNFAEYMRDPNNNLQGAIQLLQNEADIAGLSLSDMFSNVRAGMGALQLAQDEMGVFNTFMTDMAQDSHLVEDAYNKMMDTRANKWKRMREQLKNISISIVNSDAVQNILDNLTKSAQGFLNRIEEWLPSMLTKLDIFYQKARLIFTFLKREYEGSFLQKGIKFGIDVVRNGLQDIIDKFKNGDIFGAIVEVGTDVFLLKMGFKLATNAMSSLQGQMFGPLGTIGLFAMDGLMVYMRFKDAMKENDWTEFLKDFLLALGAGILAGAFLGPAGGALVFGIAFKFLGWVEDAQDRELDKASASSSSNANVASMYALPEKAKVKEKIYQALMTAGIGPTEMRKYAEAGKTLGDYLGAGVIEGLKEFRDLDYGVMTFASLLNGTFMEEEEIHSPSKVWEKYGEYLAQGLALGLSGQEAEEYARKAVNDMYDWLNEEVMAGRLTLEEALSDVDFINSEELAKKMAEKLKEAIKKAEEIVKKGPDPDPDPAEQHTPTKFENFMTAWAKGSETVFSDYSGLGSLFDNLIDDQGELTDKGRFWADTMNDALSTIAGGFENLFSDLVSGEDAWKGFARAGLEAIASIVEALAMQLLGQSISAYPDFAQMASAGAMSLTMLAGAGLIRGLANSFEYGGMVKGSGITGDRHMVWANAGELILSRAQQGAIASQLSGRGQPNITIAFNGQVFGDQQAISSYVYDGIRNAQREGGLPQW